MISGSPTQTRCLRHWAANAGPRGAPYSSPFRWLGGLWYSFSPGFEILFHRLGCLLAGRVQPIGIAPLQVGFDGLDIRGGGVQRPDFAAHGRKELILKRYIFDLQLL